MGPLIYLFWAYTLVFVALFLYLWFLQRRQAGNEAELKRLSARVEALRTGLGQGAQ
ncbi:MAG: CcmD family protein [Deltaproteobacteria bacterium]|nr:CcmD family protein [Deltaproteobacteria bacterium]